MPDVRPTPWATYALIAANVAMFAVELARGASALSPSTQQLVALGASFPPLTLHGQWWRLGASMFLHFGAIHIGVNMICLYQGQIVEHIFGRFSFLVIYLIAGLGGGVATLLVGDPHGVSAGASGAVFGVYGAFGAFLVLRRSQIDPVAWRQTARSIAQFLVLNLVIGLTARQVSLSAHVGGLITGFAVAAGLLVGPGFATQRIVRSLALAVAGVALTAVAVTTIHADADVTPVLNKFNDTERSSALELTKALDRARGGEIKTPQVADVIDRDVLPAYTQMRQDLLAASDIPANLRPLFRLLDTYTAARIVSWKLYAQALREPELANQAAEYEAFRAHEAEVDKLRKAYEAEADRVSAR